MHNSKQASEYSEIKTSTCAGILSIKSNLAPSDCLLSALVALMAAQRIHAC